MFYFMLLNISALFKLENSSLNCPIISVEEVEAALKLTNRNKAAGEDGLMYEHLIYGGSFMSDILSKFYNAVIKLSYAPKDLKRGVIVTIFKGGNKRKDNPDNYRAVTLSSVVIKLLERILLTRIELFDTIHPPLHPLQGGFRKQMGCMMTSFLVRESIHFAKENGSKVYACFLDIRKAFDQVWHDGLFYKLYNCGIDKAILKILLNLYTGMESCVRTQTHKSGWFPVLQGTRQGGVISPFLFLIYTNELLWELENSGFGMGFLNNSCASPAVADDMVLISLSKFGLDQMIKMCYESSCKWHYEYQPHKCSVVVYNESKTEFNRANRIWRMGNSCIQEDTQYKHLGIYCNKYLSLDENVKSAVSKLKGTLLSMANCGIYEAGLNPLTSKHIYRTIVLQKALYGCELWDNLSHKHLYMLERAHRFCVKYMQSLPRRTNTDLALSLLNLYNIEREIDYRKLMFFRQLCCLPSAYRTKNVFLYRLLNFSSRIGVQRGFLQDIYRILGKYTLTHVFHTFMENGTFISKGSWKRLVCERIREQERVEWASKTRSSPSFQRLNNIHNRDKEYIVWYLCRQSPYYLNLAYKAVPILARMFSGKWQQNCYLCGDYVFSVSEHLLLDCARLCDIRDILWKRLLNRFGVK